MPNLSAEEEQLQWALNASLEEVRSPPAAGGQPVAGARSSEMAQAEAPGSRAAASAAAPLTDFNSSAGENLQAAAAAAAQRLREAEERARRSEEELVAVRS